MTQAARLIELRLATHSGGGKASGLARMAEAGLPVPPGFVVPADVPDDAIDSVAREIEARFEAPLAVRSSADAEDLTDASHAGEYETVLGVAPEAGAIAGAIQRVRASAPQDAGMSVLVMEMIEPLAAGVAFTRDPMTGDEHVVIEATAGLADRLVAGEAVGERWVVDDAGPRPIGRASTLSADLAVAVAKLAGQCETVAGRPQDIEWAYDGTLHLLQSRAITTLGIEPIPIREDAPPGEWMWDSTHDQIPKTTLTLSSFLPGFEAASRRLVDTYGLPLDHLAARSIGGYIHIQPVPPIGDPGGAAPPAPLMRLAFAVHPTLRRIAKRAKTALSERTDRAMLNEWRANVRPDIERRLERFFDLDSTSLSDADLHHELETAVELSRTVFGWNMVTDPAYLLPIADLHDFLDARGLGDMQTVTSLVAGSARSELATSLDALGALVTPDVAAVVDCGGADVLDRLDQVAPDFANAYRTHLRRHGQRVLGLDVEYPTIVEDPGLELRVVTGRHRLRNPNVQAETLAGSIRSGFSDHEADVFDALLADARATYPIREEGEGVNNRTWGAVRLLALEAGRRMAEVGHVERPDDAVHLEVHEIREWLSERIDLRDRVRTRKGQRLWARSHPPTTSEEAMPDAASFPPAIRRVMRAMELIISHDGAPPEIGDGADGVGASPGIHTGPVRLILTPEDLDRVEPGDVLVAPLTSSPWEFVFAKVGAVVSEGGGLLSHPAIVSREYGIPAVVGCAGATTRFSEGQVVTVDGSAGTVRAVDHM